MTESKHISKVVLSELKSLGIDEKMLASMPEEVRRPLLSGGVTPLVEARINIGNGHQILLPVKLQVIAGKGGQGQLMLYPVQKRIKNSLNLNQAELETLRSGGIVSKIINDNGVMRPQLLQLDPHLNSIIKTDPGRLKLQEKLRDFEKVNDIELGAEQKLRIREGKPVELSVGGKKVSMGLDLRQPDGFLTLQGDLKEWERQQKIDYDLAHPEFKGYVMTDKNEWEYQQVIKAKSNSEGESEKAKQELGRKSGFHI